MSLACIKQIENDIDDYFDKKEGIDLKKELRQALDNEIQISVLGVSVYTSDVFQSFKYYDSALWREGKRTKKNGNSSQEVFIQWN